MLYLTDNSDPLPPYRGVKSSRPSRQRAPPPPSIDLRLPPPPPSTERRTRQTIKQVVGTVEAAMQLVAVALTDALPPDFWTWRCDARVDNRS